VHSAARRMGSGPGVSLASPAVVLRRSASAGNRGTRLPAGTPHRGALGGGTCSLASAETPAGGLQPSSRQMVPCGANPGGVRSHGVRNRGM